MDELGSTAEIYRALVVELARVMEIRESMVSVRESSAMGDECLTGAIAQLDQVALSLRSALTRIETANDRLFHFGHEFEKVVRLPLGIRHAADIQDFLKEG